MRLLLYLRRCLLYLLYGMKFYKHVRQIAAVFQGKHYFPGGPREALKSLNPHNKIPNQESLSRTPNCESGVGVMRALCEVKYPWK
jgi:hypothetical protein